MAAVPARILSAMENTSRELNELERRLQSAMNDSSPNMSLVDEMKNSPCKGCQELRKTQKSPSKQSRRMNLENQCPSCVELNKRLEFMNDEMNRVCENESKLKERVEVLTCDYEMAQQELAIAHCRIDGKAKTIMDNIDEQENLKSQLLANSADRISALQFELERKVDELQRLGEEHRHMLSLHYSKTSKPRQTTRFGLRKQTPVFASEFMDISPPTESKESLEHKQAIESHLKAVSELKLQLCEIQKQLTEKDSKLSAKEAELMQLSEAHSKLEGQLKTYMDQFEKLQGVVAEYKEREDTRYSKGVHNSDITQLEEDFPEVPESEPAEANGETDHFDEFFEELEELSSRLEESRLQQSLHDEEPKMESSRLDALTPRKKCVSFALDCEPESSFEVSTTFHEDEVSQNFNDSKLAKIALLEQRARAFELRAENLNVELVKVVATLTDVNEARDDLSELVKVQEERIALFLAENEDLKSKLNRTVQDSFDDTVGSEGDLVEVRHKEQKLQSMIAEIELRNSTIRDMAKSMNESRGETTVSSELNADCSEIVSGSDNVSNELQRLTARLNEINRENDLLNSQVDKAKNVIETLKKRIETYDDPNTTVERQMFDKSLADNSQLDYMKHDNEMLLEKLDLIQEKYAESEADVEAKEKQLVHLRQVVRTKEERVRSLEDEVEKKEVKIASYIAMIKKMKETKKFDEEERNQEEQNLEEEKARMDEIVKSAEAEKTKFEQEKNKIEEEKTKIEKELNFAKLRYNDLKGQMEDIENDYENLTNELAQIHELKTKLESELVKSNERNSECRTKIASLEKDIAVRNVETQNAKSVKWSLETEIADLKDHVSELESKLTQKKENDSKSSDDLVEENKYLKSCVDETMDRLAEADKETMQLRNNLDEANDQILSLEKDILIKDDKIDQLQAKADEIEDLRAQVQHSEDKRQLLEKVVFEKENHVKNLGDQIQTFSDKNDALEEELSTASKNVGVLQTALDSREKELELIQEEISTEKAEKESLHDQVKTLREKLEEIKLKPLNVEVATPRKDHLIDFSPVKSAPGTPRTIRLARRVLTPAKRTLNLEHLAAKLNEPVEPNQDLSEHHISTSTLCFDLLERSIDNIIEDIGPIGSKIPNDSMVLRPQSVGPSQDSFISGVGTVSTPCGKTLNLEQNLEQKLQLQTLRSELETKAQNLVNQIEGLELECNDLKSRSQKLEESNENYQNLLQGSKEHQKTLELRVLDLIHANHELQEKLKEKVALCDQLSSERDRMINEFGNEEGLQRKVLQVEKEKRELSFLLERLRCELGRVTGLNMRLHQQMNEMNERIENVDDVESELDDYKQALAEAELANDNMKEEMNEKINELSNQVTEAKTQFLQANAKILRFQNIESELQTLNSKYDEVHAENHRMSDEILQLQSTLEKLQTIEDDFNTLQLKNTKIREELSNLESLLEDQDKLKKANADLETKCKTLCEKLEALKGRAEKADYLAEELDRIRDHYEELLEAKSQNESEMEKNLSQLETIDANSRQRLEELHADVRRAMEAKFQLELDLQQALSCARESDSKHAKIASQLSRIMDERNDIVQRLNDVTRKLEQKDKEKRDEKMNVTVA